MTLCTTGRTSLFLGFFQGLMAAQARSDNRLLGLFVLSRMKRVFQAGGFAVFRFMALATLLDLRIALFVLVMAVVALQGFVLGMGKCNRSFVS